MSDAILGAKKIWSLRPGDEVVSVITGAPGTILRWENEVGYPGGAWVRWFETNQEELVSDPFTDLMRVERQGPS